MNKVIIMGRLTRDPEVRYSQGDTQVAIARYTLAVDRPKPKNGEQATDFISCVTFGKTAEFAEKYLHKGMRILIEGSIRTGRYDKDGTTIYTTDVLVNSHEFCEGKGGASSARDAADDIAAQQYAESNSQNPLDGFMNIPDGIDEELPFS